eukprot:TRINITY_DN2798_c1_g2_i1.p1 TRINITY_DN2798_c1_g2~~TRINITY_DN2798_c1_g2_i1.p1  ORF type:complete len:1728 (+),score=656.39 TRINITY_DN2798_c1_g2_i1:88-5271(+)
MAQHSPGSYGRSPTSDPEHLASRYNSKQNEQRRAALEEEVSKTHADIVRRRRDLMREAAAAKRAAHKEQEAAVWKEHRKATRSFRQARAYETHLDACVLARAQRKAQLQCEKVRAAAEGGIDAFEANLKKLKADQVVYDTRLRRSHGDTAYQERLMARRGEQQASRADRAQRCQQVLLEQQRGYRRSYEAQREDQLLHKITKMSGDEKALIAELRTQAQWMRVMSHNRQFREKQYESRQEEDAVQRRAVEDETKRREILEYEKDKREELQKVRHLVAEKEAAKKEKRKVMCGGIVAQVVELAIKSAEFRERTDESGPAAATQPARWADWCQEFLSKDGAPVEPVLAPAALWREWTVQLLTDTDTVEPAERLQSPPRPPRTADGESAAPSGAAADGHEEVEEPPAPSPDPVDPLLRNQQEEALRTLCDVEARDYVHHQNLWAVPGKAPPGGEFNGSLCRLVRDTCRTLHPPRAPFRRRDPEGQATFSLIVFTGKPLCGKGAAADRAARETGFCSENITELVRDALEFRSAHLDDLDQVLASLPPDQEDILRERCQLARRAQDELHEGLPISDPILVALVLNRYAWLRARAFAVAAAGIGPHSDPPPADSKWGAPSPADAKRGLILRGFPATAAQFQLLEENMTTYDAADLVEAPARVLFPPPPDGEEEEDEPTEPPSSLQAPLEGATPSAAPAATLAPPAEAAGRKKSSAAEQPPQPPAEVPAPPPVEPPPTLPPLTGEEEALLADVPSGDCSGVDLVVHFECSDDEVFARHSGQRVDPETSTVYHLLYDPPPNELLSHLEKVHRSRLERTLLHTKLCRFRHHNKRLMTWLGKGGVQVKHVDATASIGDLVGSVTAAVADSVEQADRRMRTVREREELLGRRAVMEDELTAWIDLRAAGAASKKAAEEEEAKAAAEAVKQTPASKAAQAAAPASVIPVTVTTVPHLPVDLSPDLAACVLQQLDSMSEAYFSGVRVVLVELRQLRRQGVDHCVSLSQTLRDFLQRPDVKQVLVAKFQDDFNAFEPELRSDPDGLAELHFRAEVLQTELQREVDKKKAEAEDQIRGYEKREWFDLWRKSVTAQFRELLQLELMRFQITRSVVRFLYNARFLRDTIPQEPPLLDLCPKEVESEAPAKGGKKDPKKVTPPVAGKGRGKGDAAAEQDAERPDEFQQAYKQVLEWIEKPEPAAEESTKDSQKQAQKRKPSSVPESDQEKIDPAEQKARRVWIKEQELLKYRVNAICAKYYAFIDEVQEKSKCMQDRMAAWLGARHMRELGAVAALLKTVRIAIEEREPLRSELKLDGERFIIDNGSLLAAPADIVVLTPPLPSDDDDLVCVSVTKGQMTVVIQELRARAPGGLCDRAGFVRVWLRVCAAAQSRPESLPQCWQTLRKQDFEAAFEEFDWLKKGVLDWHQYCTSMLLWSDSRHDSPFTICCPSLQALVELRDTLYDAAQTAAEDDGIGVSPKAEQCNEYVDEEGFTSAQFWFQSNGDVSDTRAKQLKDLLWAIFRNADGKVHWPTFLLYLCTDPQIIRGAQKGFAMLSHSSLDGRLSRAQIHELFHFTPYCAAGDVGDPCSEEVIASAFEGERVRQEQEARQQAFSSDLSQSPQGEDGGGEEPAAPAAGLYRTGGITPSAVTEDADPESKFVAQLGIGTVVAVEEVKETDGVVAGRVSKPVAGWITLAAHGVASATAVPAATEEVNLAFQDLCSSHQGRVMLNSGLVFLLRRPSFL